MPPRLRFRRVDKEQLIRVGTRLAVAGLALLAVGMSASVYVTTQLIYGSDTAAVVATGVVAAAGSVWFVLPLAYAPSPHDEAER